MGLFSRKSLLDPDILGWQLDVFEWLTGSFGWRGEDSGAPLVLPTADFFPSRGLAGHELARDVFDSVKRFAGLAEWPCDLVAQEEDLPTHLGQGIAQVNSASSPLGTFRFPEGESEVVTITYNPRVLEDRVSLVATFAHELGHYLTATAETDPPGGFENWEYVTDVTAAYLGFGVFLANSAFNFHQFQNAEISGWQWSRSGYLSETDLLAALTIDLHLRRAGPEAVSDHLKPSLRKALRRVFAEVGRESDRLEEIKACAAHP
jgi:hypothetical protein